MISRRALLGLFAGAAVVGSGAAHAAGKSPVAAVRNFYAVLLQVMKNGPRLGFAGRRERLTPTLEQFFDFRLMTRLLVGPQWSSLAPQQQQQILAAFSTFSIATYANRFDDYSGERFEVSDQPVPTGAGNEIVKSRLVQSNGEPVELDYLMHDDNGTWRAVDVYLSGTVSELATRRSEFASVLRRGGPSALVDVLRRKTAELSG
ncbi:MAG: ABC transporter substrate-binding protein [Stellaceae bacterium]